MAQSLLEFRARLIGRIGNADEDFGFAELGQPGGDQKSYERPDDRAQQKKRYRNYEPAWMFATWMVLLEVS
jgi:hypothetical protein